MGAASGGEMEPERGNGPAHDRWPWSRVQLFRGLGDDALAQIAEHLSPRSFVAGEVMIRQGIWQGALSIIRAGIVQISLETEPDAEGNGATRTVSLRRLVAGECFGEMSLITGQLPSATATALTDGELWTLDQADFLRLVTAQPELSRNINAILSERLLHTNRRQSDAEPAQVIVGVGTDAAFWETVARTVARLSARAVLLIDLLATEGGGEPTLADLLGGRLRLPAADDPDRGANDGGALTIVRGGGGEDASDLPSILGRLAESYQFLLVALPPRHPLLTTELLTYATRALVAGRADDLLDLRGRIAALPRAGATPESIELGIVLTDAPVRVRRTVATLDLLQAELGAPVRAIVPGEGRRYGEEFAALGRWIVGQRIGLVFGAGGPKGFAQVGALRALRRAGLPVDVVAGTSVGAIIGGGVALDRSMEEIEAGVASILGTLFRPTVPVRAILSNRALVHWARSPGAFGEHLLEDLPIPYAVSAADLSEGREIVIRRGRLWQAILASAAIPGIYPPVMIGRHWLVDGGVVNPVPVSIAQLLGADLIVALDLSEPLAPREELTLDASPALRAPLLPDTLLRSRDIMMSEIRSHTVGEPAVLINPKVSGVSLRNVRDAAPYEAAGEAATEEILPRLRRILPWLGN